MRDRELMQRALDALDSDNPDIQLRAAIALRDRLAQPEPEPVAWRFQSAVGGWAYGKEPPIGSKYAVEPLYAAPVHAIDISQKRVDETGKDRHEPESNDVEIAAEQSDNYAAFLAGVRFARVNLLKEKNGG